MWPFTSKPDRVELRELTQKVLDLEQRFKVLEREHDDLHAAYRRLRGARAVEARDAPKERPSAQPGEPEEHPGPLSKDELRRRFLTVGTRKLRGDGELPQ